MWSKYLWAWSRREKTGTVFLTFFAFSTLLDIFTSQKLLWNIPIMYQSDMSPYFASVSSICRLPLSDLTVPTLPSQQHKSTEQRKITVRNQFHNDCRCIWITLLVIRRFYSRGQQPFLLLANNCISTNVATTRLTRSLLATRALYLQLRKVTEQLNELPLISLTF